MPWPHLLLPLAHTFDPGRQPFYIPNARLLASPAQSINAEPSRLCILQHPLILHMPSI
jgi:hypothetical protein